MEWEDVYWIGLSPYSEKSRVIVNAVTKFRVRYNTIIFVTF